MASDGHGLRPRQCRRRRGGQSVTEYAVILALIAMLCVVLLRSIGTTTSNSMNPVNEALSE